MKFSFPSAEEMRSGNVKVKSPLSKSDSHLEHKVFYIVPPSILAGKQKEGQRMKKMR